MTHIMLHFLIPIIVAVFCYRSHWQRATLILFATMLVDLDHLLSDPIYDPGRCSIGFHPLHTTPAILFYTVLFVAPVFMRKTHSGSTLHTAHLVGLGLLIHMALDGLDCLL